MYFAQLLVLAALPKLYYAAPVVDKCALLGACGQTDGIPQVQVAAGTSGLSSIADAIRKTAQAAADVAVSTGTHQKMSSALGISVSSNEILSEYSTFFETYDEDKNGLLSKAEFEKILSDRNVRMKCIFIPFLLSG